MKHKKILIVEDEELCMTLYRNILTPDEGFDIVEAKTGEDGLEILKKENFQFDLCIIDQNLPGMMGDELLSIIKDRAPKIAVVIITGDMDEQFIYSCLKKGALEYIQKPIVYKTFIRTIKNAIKRQSKINEIPGEIKIAVKTKGWVELTAPSEMEYLARMQKFTNVLLQSKLSKQISDDLYLIIEEVGRNSIEWGNEFNRKKDFHISYCIFNDSIVIKFEDEGEGFSPEKLHNPTTDPIAHIKKRKEDGKRPGGFGVYMIQKMMDEVIYSERGNSVIMTKYF